MARIKMLAATTVVAALVVGPFGAAPAHAQCEEALEPPYSYPCKVAEDGAAFVIQEANDALVFAGQVYNEVGELVFWVACTLFPPQCP